MTIRLASLGAALTLVLASPTLAREAAPTAPKATSLQQLVSEVKLPYEKFTLDNGLTVVVHTDRKAPLVGVSVWYDVGSKDEPAGKTGFAHLFEHLMFNGTVNAPKDWFDYIEQIGGTDVNGTTNTDRTNYFETVPTGALDRTLMLESDRMGHLLGAMTQDKLDKQRGVVQNEKRQGDNQPFGLLRYEIFENLFPAGHPYHHSTIGSMADLNSATLDDVRNWFTDHYGPNNAVLVLAGDIDAKTAREKVQKWFGDIPRGPEVKPPMVTVPTLPAPVSKTVTDQISTTRLYRMWTVPGENSADSVPLDLASSVLGGLASSRLDNALVRGDPVAVSVAAYNWSLEDAGVFIVQADVKPGVDPGEVAAKLDAQIADFIAKGPTADELERAKVSAMAGTIRGLESVGGFGGQAPQLASGELFTGDPGYVETQLKRMAAATPAQVAELTRKWLSRPALSLVFKPGERTDDGASRGGAYKEPRRVEDVAQSNYCRGDVCTPEALAETRVVDRSTLPPVGQLKSLDFPAIERARLSNGMEVIFARRDAVPTVSVMVEFDAGRAAESRATLGTQRLMLGAMDEGTTDLDSTALAIAKERLAADIGGNFDADWTTFTLAALAPNLAPSLDLLADYIRHPGFRDGDIERVRSQLLNGLTAELKNPNSVGDRALRQELFGDHPYGLPGSGLGTAETLKGLTRADLQTFHDTWLRPDIARIYVVGDTTLKQVMPLLETSFGNWKAPASAKPLRHYNVPIPAPEAERIILLDRPNSPQSVILGGRILPYKGTDNLVPLSAANEVLGSGFLARINMNLREDKSWSYGASSYVASALNNVRFGINAPVQADRTGDSITELRREMKDFTTTKGTQPAELDRIVNSNTRDLPGQFETADDVLSGVVNITRFHRPDRYYTTLADQYRTLTAPELDGLARANFVENNLVFVVVGDAKVVYPQLDALGLPVEVREAQ